MDAIKVIKRDQDIGPAGESMIPADVLKFPGGEDFVGDACGSSNRAVSLHFAAVNACHSEGRYRMSRERALTKARTRTKIGAALS